MLKSKPPPTAVLAFKNVRREIFPLRTMARREPLGRLAQGFTEHGRALSSRGGPRLRRLLDRGTDALVCAAAADIAGHRRVDIAVAGIGISRQQAAADMIWPDWQ